MAHVSYSSHLKAKIRRITEASLGKKLARPPSQSMSLAW
jgi:hypothetical protein